VVKHVGTEHAASSGRTLFIVGGGARGTPLMRRFVDLCSGAEGTVVVVPFASPLLMEQAQPVREELRAAGALDVHVVRDTGVDAAALAEQAAGVYITGGDQNLLRDRLAGTPLLASIMAVYSRGIVIGGTSAGAAVMSRVMVTGRELRNPGVESPDDGDAAEAFTSICAGNIETADGFGFLEDCVIDQHFIRRKRFNRLASVVLEHPHLLGIGIDERTAVIMTDSGFDVVGAGSVVVFDASHVSDIAVSPAGNLSCSALILHILTEGQHFDMAGRTVTPAGPASSTTRGGTHE